MNHSDLRQRAIQAGRNAFGDDWTVDGWSVAPGRIELIGNHTDYNGGPVLAGAIDRVMVMASGPIAETNQIGLIAGDLSSPLARCTPANLEGWRSGPRDRGPIVYVKGIVAALLARGIPVRTGIGLAVVGDIPPGFGMSSSAALCLATILALTADEIDKYNMVAIAREAEHRAGAMVGAMDQSASLAGGIIAFDGRDNTFQQIEPHLGDLVFAVADSGVNRSLRTSSYGTRVREGEEARQALQDEYGFELPNLAAAADYWMDIEPTLTARLSPTLAKRVRHVVTETLRVREAEIAVRESDWAEFGRLMDASGRSSALDYEISHPVVEELVAHLRQQPGVLGARMMGGGEGGPALVLMDRAVESAVRESLEPFYKRHPIKRPERAFYTCTFGPGAHREPA